MKTLVFKIVTDIEEGIDNMDEYVTDWLYNYAEGIGEILDISSEIRDSTPEEEEAFKTTLEDADI